MVAMARSWLCIRTPDGFFFEVYSRSVYCNRWESARDSRISFRDMEP